MKLKSERVGSDAGNGGPKKGAPGEAKRLAARRRFLIGGAAALPLIVTLGQREAWAASSSVCKSMGVGYDWKYAKKDLIRKLQDGERVSSFQVSAYCDPNRRWS